MVGTGDGRLAPRKWFAEAVYRQAMMIDRCCCVQAEVRTGMYAVREMKTINNYAFEEQQIQHIV